MMIEEALVYAPVNLKGYPPTERGVKQCQGNVGQQGQVRIFGLRKTDMEWGGKKKKSIRKARINERITSGKEERLDWLQIYQVENSHMTIQVSSIVVTYF